MVNSQLNLRSRLLAISDIHGCETGLKKLLASAGYSPSRDRLVLLGDYIDAGNPGTYGTLRYIRALAQQGACVLPGNHELKLLRRLEDAPSSDAEAKTWRSWISGLPRYLLEDGYLFVHAGIRQGVGLDRQSLTDLTEIREGFLDRPAEDGLTVVFGHTPTSRLGAQPGNLWFGEGKIGIDTGAKHGQRLTLFDVHPRIGYWCATGPDANTADVNTTYY